MPNIIERLRANESANILTNEAADEIHRLRSVIIQLHDQRGVLMEQVIRDGKTVDIATKIIMQIKQLYGKSDAGRHQSARC